MGDTQKSSVLIIDDELSNLRILTHILKPDYTIYTALNGKTAIEIAKEFQPSLILLDVIMPNMDGYEVLSALKESEMTAKIPVIFITGLNSEAHKAKGRELGVADNISKPFNADTVKAKISNQLTAS